MNEAFEINGFWWLPETPKTRVPGVLSFSPGDILRLKLMGTLNKTRKEDFPPPDFINPDIIHGISSSGESVTLSKCIRKSGNSSIGDAGSYYTTEFIVHYAFFGTHFPTQADIQFTNLSACFHNLDNWYNKSCVQNDTTESGIVITFKRPVPIDIQLKDFNVRIAIFERQGIKLNSVFMSANSQIQIYAKPKKPLSDFLDLLSLIQNFLTFSITKPTFVTEINGRLTETIEPADGKFISPITIKIFYAAVGWQSDAKEVFGTDMLLSFREVENILPDILRVWVEKSETIKPVYDLYFAGLYKSTYLENEFLSLTQAIETYHRRRYGGQYLTDEVFLNGLYKTLIAAIPSDIPDDFRSSLKNGKLRYAHEYSLRKRILLLSEHISENISVSFLGDKKIYAAFAEKVTDTRNYLTHYSSELRDKAIISGAGLHELNQQLRLIIKICLLEELGVPFDRIVTLLKRDRIFKVELMRKEQVS